MRSIVQKMIQVFFLRGTDPSISTKRLPLDVTPLMELQTAGAMTKLIERQHFATQADSQTGSSEFFAHRKGWPCRMHE